MTLLASCAAPGRPPSAAPGEATVERVVDGDTIVVSLGGRSEDVRLIGIDTPESVARDRPVECYGPEAKAWLTDALPPGTRVRLERDVEARDRYGRLLAYVVRDDGLFLNLALVEQGLAESSPFRPNTAHQGALDTAEAQARQDQRGLWPVCGSTDVAIGPPARR